MREARHWLQTLLTVPSGTFTGNVNRSQPPYNLSPSRRLYSHSPIRSNRTVSPTRRGK